MVINQFKINKHTVGQCFRKMRDFPGSPVVKMPPFQFRGWGAWIQSLVGKPRSLVQCGQKKKLRCPDLSDHSSLPTTCLIFFLKKKKQLSSQIIQGSTLRRRARARPRASRETSGMTCKRHGLPPLLSCSRRKRSIHSPSGQRYLPELACPTQSILSF